MNALETSKLSIQFGGLKAVKELDLAVPQGAIFGLIGPNGAGKTTVFNMLTGVYRPTEGTIRCQGKNLVGLKPFEITHQGLARTFQNIRLFRDLSVLDNLLIARDQSPVEQKFGLFSTVWKSKKLVTAEASKRHACTEILRIFNLGNRTNTLARNLPYGDQRRLEIARAIATGARMLLLDEPAAGLNANETSSLMKTITLIREQFQATVLLIEHDMKLVMGICEKIVVLDYGQKIAEGTPAEIQRHEKVIEAYLGKGSQKGDTGAPK